MTSGEVAVIAVTYRSADDVPGFLSSLPNGIAEVLLVDNPSSESDATVEAADAAGVRVLRLQDNVGYGGAVNAGAAALRSDARYLLVANPDVQLHDGAVDALVDALKTHPRVGAVGPQILNEDGTVYPSARDIPSLRVGVGHALFFRVWPRNPWSRRYRQEDARTDVARDVGWLSGACLLIRREAFDRVGGFDAGYFMYFEDVDLGYRLGRAGWSNRYEPTAVATHVGGRSTSTDASRMLRVHHRSAERFLERKYTGWHLAPLRLVLHLGLELRAHWLTRGMRSTQSSNDDRYRP